MSSAAGCRRAGKSRAGRRSSATFASIQKATRRIAQLDAQGHLAERVRRAAEARVETANDGFDAIERAFGDPCTAHEMPGSLGDALIHRQTVVTGRNDEVGPANQAVVVDPVMVDQRTARRFGNADAFG